MVIIVPIRQNLYMTGVFRVCIDAVEGFLPVVFVVVLSAEADLYLNSDDNLLLQMALQMVRQRMGVTVHPSQILRIQADGNLPIRMQISLFNGPVHQFVGYQVQMLVVIIIACNQINAILIDTSKPHHLVLLIYIDPDLRIDLHVYRGVRLGAAGKGKTQRQRHTGSRGSQYSDPAVAFPSGGSPHRLYFCEHLSHLILAVGHLQESACFVQYHRIAGMAFHNHIFQAGTPPRFQT